MKHHALSALLAATLAAGFAGQCARAQAPEVKTAEQVYKNITQLKGTPADQLNAAMQFISVSLGVECENCHVAGKYEADDKGAKRTAREMMAMTAAINKDSFRGQQTITCYSCHRGSERPVGSPPVLDSDTPARPAARPAAGAPAATPDDMIAKYLTAAGGADAMHHITSRAMKGTVMAMEMCIRDSPGTWRCRSCVWPPGCHPPCRASRLRRQTRL